jgi:replicative DNA helicase
MKIGLSTGYNSIDEATGGFQGGDLITIAGYTMTGKTALALSMARNIAVEQRIPVLFISLGMSNTCLVQRLIATTCDIPLQKIINTQLYPNDWNNLDSRINELIGAPFYIEDTPWLGTKELLESCRHAVSAHLAKAIFIDCLQLINWTYHYNRSIDEEQSEIVFSLKSLAKELNIPIVVVSSLKRKPQKEDPFLGKLPEAKELPGNGTLESISDYVLLMHRPELYHIYQDEHGRDLHGIIEIQLVKNARGYGKDVFLKFKASTGSFSPSSETPYNIEHSAIPPFM